MMSRKQPNQAYRNGHRGALLFLIISLVLLFGGAIAAPIIVYSRSFPRYEYRYVDLYYQQLDETSKVIANTFVYKPTENQILTINTDYGTLGLTGNEATPYLLSIDSAPTFNLTVNLNHEGILVNNVEYFKIYLCDENITYKVKAPSAYMTYVGNENNIGFTYRGTGDTYVFGISICYSVQIR